MLTLITHLSEYFNLPNVNIDEHHENWVYRPTDNVLDERKNTFLHANNKVQVLSAHPRSLISSFIILSLDSLISKLATCNISAIMLVSVAKQTGFSVISVG